jgi:hypothetical protein
MTRSERDTIPDEEGGATKVQVTIRRKAKSIGSKAMHVLFVPLIDREVEVERKCFVPLRGEEVVTGGGGEVGVVTSGSGKSGGSANAASNFSVVTDQQLHLQGGKAHASAQLQAATPVTVAADGMEGWKTCVDEKSGNTYRAQYGLPAEDGGQKFTGVPLWTKPPPPPPDVPPPVALSLPPVVAQIGASPSIAVNPKQAEVESDDEGEAPVDFEVGDKIVKKTKKGAQGQKAQSYTWEIKQQGSIRLKERPKGEDKFDIKGYRMAGGAQWLQDIFLEVYLCLDEDSKVCSDIRSFCEALNTHA